MKVHVEEISPVEKKLSIEVESQAIEDELKAAYTRLSHQVKVPGFRPGKAPRRILEQKYKADVENDVLQRIVELHYLRAIAEKEVDAVARPQVKNDRLIPGKPFSFEARVAVKPKVEPKDYAGLALKKIDTAVPEAKVDERLESMRGRMARLEPIEGRDVANLKDYATVDYDASMDGKPFPGSTAQNVTVEVGPGEMVESNIGALDGVKVGDTKEVDYTFPNDYANEELRGKTAKFRITLKGIKKQVTPDLDDDFAKEIGGGNTLAEMKAKVRGDLEAAAKVQAQQEERENLLKALVEKNAFEVPGAMVDRAVEGMLENAIRSIARSGVDPRQLGLDFGKLREEMRDRATLEVKGSLLLEAIALKEKIEATDAEIEARVEKIATESGAQGAQVRKHFKGQNERRGLSLSVREDKTLEFLKAKAKHS